MESTREKRPAQTILFVDDEEDSHAIATAELQRDPTYEYNPVSAFSLTEALDLLENREFDAILLDLRLGDSIPTESVARVHQAAPWTPIVVVSGFRDDATILDALRQGADDYVFKDELDRDHLRRSLRYALGRKRAQAQVRALIAHNADGMLVLDQDGRIRFANPAALEIFGRGARDLVGTHFSDAKPGTGGKIEVLGKKGTLRTVEIRTSRIDWQGAPARLVSLRDITDREQAIQQSLRQERADLAASTGRLAAGLAHAINDPAAVIGGNLTAATRLIEALRSTLAAKSAEEFPELRSALDELAAMRDDAEESVESLASTARQLRAFVPLSPRPAQDTNLNDAVEQACRVAANEIRHRASLVKSFAPVPLVQIDGDSVARAIVQVLLNTAWALPEGEARANEIRVTTGTEGDDVVLAIVCERTDADSTLPDGAWGGPLASAAETIESSGGRLIATRGGSSIRVEIFFRSAGVVVAATDRDPLLRPPKALPAELPDRGRGRVLLVDDDELVLASIRRMVEGTHDVVGARDGGEALEILSEDDAFDAIVCDIMMPDVDGRMFYEQLAISGPNMTNRVIFITAGAFSEQNAKFLQEVSDRTLLKPIPLRALLEAIEQVRPG